MSELWKLETSPSTSVVKNPPPLLHLKFIFLLLPPYLSGFSKGHLPAWLATPPPLDSAAGWGSSYEGRVIRSSRKSNSTLRLIERAQCISLTWIKI